MESLLNLLEGLTPDQASQVLSLASITSVLDKRDLIELLLQERKSVLLLQRLLDEVLSDANTDEMAKKFANGATSS